MRSKIALPATKKGKNNTENTSRWSSAQRVSAPADAFVVSSQPRGKAARSPFLLQKLLLLSIED
jgi:hypothetical protein